MGVEAAGAGEHLKAAVAAAAMQGSADAAAAFAPVPGDRATFRDDAALQVESVGVAGAGQGHLHGGPGDRVIGAAADALGRSVVEADGAAAVPTAAKARKRSGLRMAGRSTDGGHEQNGGCDQQSPEEPKSLVDGSLVDGSFVEIIAAMLPSHRCTVSPLMPHSTFPIRYCRSTGRLHTHH